MISKSLLLQKIFLEGKLKSQFNNKPCFLLLYQLNFWYRLDDLKDDFEATDKMFTDLETKVDGLRKELYKNHEPTIKELPPLDLNKAEQIKARCVIN